MKKLLFRKVTASFLALVMILTSIPFNLVVYSTEGESQQQQQPTGLGIVNNSYSSEQATHNDYIIEFYDENRVKQTNVPQFILKDSANDIVYVNQEGKFELTKGRNLNFTTNLAFSEYINDNNIKYVQITFVPHTNTNDMTYKLYSETLGDNADHVQDTTNSIIYTIDNTKQKVDENNQPVYEIDPDTGEYDHTKPVMVHKDIDNADYSMTTFTSTALKEQDVSIYWRDTGETDRPASDSITLSLKQNNNAYTVETFAGVEKNPNITNPTSSETLYTYTVPEFDESGTEYNYTSELSGNYANYRYEPDQQNQYVFYKQRTFECTLDWHSGNINYTPTEEEVKQYILTNFTFHDDTKDEDITLTADRISYDSYNKKVIISGLDEIDYSGVVKAYHLEIKNFEQEKGHALIDTAANIGDADDKWAISAENHGVNSAVTDKIYRNGTISNVLKGTRNFTANIAWTDVDNAQTRINSHDPTGSVSLWRYSDNNDTDKEEKVAQVSSQPIFDTTTNTYVPSVSFADVEKYDPEGYPYKYYAKENLSYNNAESNKDYEVQYFNGNYAEDNGTITNHLAKDIIFTVDAKWIAAARQGGTAEVTYQVQRAIKDENGEITGWEPVQTPKLDEYGEVIDNNNDGVPDEYEDSLTISGFHAETMEQERQFGPVPKYDESGKAITYRVVQTALSRTDEGSSGSLPEGTVVDDKNPNDAAAVDYHIDDINGDEYDIRVTVENESNYTFEYKLVGDMDINIVKFWDDTANNDFVDYDGVLHRNDSTATDNGSTGNIPTHNSDVIDALVNHYNFHTNQFENAYGKHTVKVQKKDENDNLVVDENDNPVYEDVEVDNYVDMHQDPHYISHSGKTETWKRTISVPIYDEEGHEYTYQVEEPHVPPHYTETITFDKTTNTFRIVNVYTPPGGPTITMKKEWQDDGDDLHKTPVNIWLDSAVTDTSTYVTEGNQPTQSVTLTEASVWRKRISRSQNYSFNSDHFKEYRTDVSTDYRTLSEIQASATIPAGTETGKEWIYGVLSTKHGTGNLSMKDQNPITFGDNFVGIFKNEHHYYAVQMTPDSAANTHWVDIVNTRIGVVNFEVEFDWRVGNWLDTHSDENDKIMIKLTPFAEGTTTQVEGMTPITQEIKISDTRKTDSQNKKYLITDLPKYDSSGKIIEWKLEEIKIDNVEIHDGSCTLPVDNETNAKCVVSTSIPTYTYYPNEHNTDDLIAMKITNAFQDETTMTISKRWFDNNDIGEFRSDIYIRLYKKDHNNVISRLPSDYELHQPEDNRNYFTYTFSGLDKYDKDGYPLTYMAHELDLKNYKTEYYSDYTYNGNQVKSTASFTDSTNNVIYGILDGGTIVNTIYGEVKIAGEKVWQNVSSDFDKKHYPIATIYLKRRLKDSTETPTAIGKTYIYSGSTNYKFTPTDMYNGTQYCVLNDDGTVKTDTDGSVILPKYNSQGLKYEYIREEESINGYTFHINPKSEDIINEFNGGRPIQITVTKEWENMDENSVYPYIEFTLHQVMYAKTRNELGQILQMDDTYKDASESTNPKLTFITYTTYTKTLRKQEVVNNTWSYTFGEIDSNGQRVHPKENLRQFAPDGTCFVYYVTEKISNYEGDNAVLNATSDESNSYLGTFDTGDYFAKVEGHPVGDFLHSDLGFSMTGLNQPARITNEGDDAYTEETKNVVIKRTADLKNSYKPDKSNYQGKIVVNKTWDNRTEDNPLNSEFDAKKDYTFTLSRKTAQIDYMNPKQLLKINTLDSTENKPKVDILVADSEFNITHGTMTYNSSEKYWSETITLHDNNYTEIGQNIPVTIKIHKRESTDEDYATMHNKVEIDGLAIYAQDATRYTYIVTEEKLNAYKEVAPQSQRMDKQGDNSYKAEFTLANELDVFTLNLYKIFGRKYTPQNSSTEVTELLSTGEYDYYFNEEFVNNLRFTLERKEGVDGEYREYRYDGTNSYYVSKVTDNGVKYIKQFTNLPKYSPNGALYYYRVKESDPPQNAHYSATYSLDGKVGDITPKDVTCYSPNEDSQNTYVCNSFEAKQILIRKYWNDYNNADGLRPENLRVQVKEDIPDISQKTINHVIKANDLWNKKIELPKYYYNGLDPISGLKYGISEEMSSAAASGVSAYNIADKGYTFEENGYETGNDLSQTKTPFTNVTDLHEISDEDFYSLYVQNKKDRVNSKLTFSKQWDDNDDINNLRPGNIYVKILRTAYTSVQPNGEGIMELPSTSGTVNLEIRNLAPEATYTVERLTINSNTGEKSWATIPSTFKDGTVSLTIEGIQPQNKVKLKLKKGSDDVSVDKDNNPLQLIMNGGSQTQEVVTTDNQRNAVKVKDTEITADQTTGVITIPSNQADNVVFENLAYGENLTGDEQNNGTFNKYFYTVVECDKDGHDINAKVVTKNEPQESGEKIHVSKNISFSIDATNINANITGRKTYLNLVVHRMPATSGQSIAEYDINGSPINSKIRNDGYYATNSAFNDPEDNAALAHGVMVVPLEVEMDANNNVTSSKITSAVIENLPYGEINNGEWNEYTYTIERSKANGDRHGTQPTSITITNTEVIDKPKYTNFSFTKTWSEDAEKYQLRPDNIYFKLYRKYEGGSEETVPTAGLTVNENISADGNGMFTVPVSANMLNVSVDQLLPNGVVVNDTTINSGIWKQYEYYIKEYDSNGDEISFSSPYKQSQEKGVENPFILADDNKTSTLSEEIKNSMEYANFSSTKDWQDENNIYNSRKNYAIQLQKKESDVGTWTTVDDLSNIAIKIDGESHSAVGNEILLDKDKLNVSFSDLPKYSPNGRLYEYRVVETKINNTAVDTNKFRLFSIPKPDNSFETSYVTKWHPGVNNYLVDYKNTVSSTKITNTIVTNYVNYIHVTAEKIWDDENNMYGKRPSEITFRLTRKIGDTPDNDFKWDQKAKESNKWKVQFSRCAAVDEEGNEYTYEVSEILGEGSSYTEQSNPNKIKITMNDKDELVKSYTFINKYEPPKKSLKASKVWYDTNNAYGLRPEKVQFELCCKYDIYEYESGADGLTPTKKKDGYDGPVYYEYKEENETKIQQSAVYDLFDDETKALFRANSSKFIIENVNGKWEKTFDNLPAYINPIGEDKTQIPTSVYQKNGNAVPVTYYIKEYIPKLTENGYSDTEFVEYKDVANYPYQAYNIPNTNPSETSPVSREITLSTDANDTTVPEAQLGNQLKTRDIVVTKKWEDNGYLTAKANYLHYDISVQLKNDSLSCNEEGRNVSGKYNETKILQANSTSALVFKDLPIYDSTGEVIEYSIKEFLPSGTYNVASGDSLTTTVENATNTEANEFTAPIDSERKYGYVGTCTKVTRTVSDKTYVTQYDIKNTLPLTAVKLVKTWDDQHNEFGLRSTGINDKNKDESQDTKSNIDLTLSRQISTESTWTKLKPDDNAEITHYYIGVKTIPTSTDTDKWEYVYKKLLKYDADNNLYTFKIEETNGNKAYLAPSPASDTITTNDELTNNGNKDWNGDNPLTETFEITNTLDTRDIKVTKAWVDKGDTTRYDIDVTLSSTQSNNGAYNTENGNTRNSDSKYSETKTIAKNASEVTFYKVPKYDKDGKVIVYNVREDANEHNNITKDDKTPTMTKNGSDTLEPIPTFTDGYRHFGYVGSAVYTATHDGEQTDKAYLTQVDITNTLPTTKIKVKKVWEVNETYHNYAKGNISVTLTRTSMGSDKDNTPTDIISAFSVSKTGTLTNGATSDIDYTDLLVYDYANTQYVYKVTETALPGYSTTYSPANGQIEAVKKESADDPLEITVTNTQKTGTLDIRKIDKTYYDAHNSVENYKDKFVNDAYFELYIKNGENKVYVPVTQQSDGTYKFENNSNNHIVKSQTSGDQKGVIKVTGLPLNTYYLKEIQDATHPLPSGYVLNDKEYTFTVDESGSVVGTTYTTDGTGDTGSFIQDNKHGTRIGNDEEPRTINFVKYDKEDNSPVANATYYLLRLRPHEIHSSEGETEADYLAAATATVRNSNGSYNSDVERYWEKVNTYHTDSQGKIGPIENMMYATYIFMEVQAPVGYEIDNSTLVPQTTTPENQSISFEHLEPRKIAKVQIFKHDEFQNPLDGAVFDLFYKPEKKTTYSISQSITPPVMMFSPTGTVTHPEPTSSTSTEYHIDSKISTPEKSEVQVITPRTDNDYIFFKDNIYYGSTWKNDSINTSYNITNVNDWNYHLTLGELNEDGKDIWASFYKPGSGDDGWIANYKVWERFVYYENGQTPQVVWKIQPPDGATRVRFYQSGTNNRTKIFTFTKGEIYGKQGNGDNVNSIHIGSWTTTPGTRGKSYEPTADKIIFRRNSKYCWDNIHIEFFDENKNPIHQEFPGYLMEPYAYANGSYRIEFENSGNTAERYKDGNDYHWGNLCYELTIPKDAKYFRINNGVNNTKNPRSNALNGYYQTEIKKILNNANRKNGGNYWKISDWDSSDKNIALTNWTQEEIENKAHDQYGAVPALTFAAESDHDYIYFCNTEGWADDNGKMYAYYYGGGDLQANNWQRAVYSIWPGLESVGKFKYNQGGRTYDVYKFRKPMGDTRAYSSVIFNNGHTSYGGGKATGNIGIYPQSSYQLGNMYYCDSGTYSNGTIHGYTTYADPNSTDTNCTFRGDYLYILNTANWDNLHVKFFDSSNNQIHQQKVGYVLKDSDSNEYGHWYRIPIPTYATQFSINNGKNSDKKTGKQHIYEKKNTEDTSTDGNYTLGDMLYELKTNNNLEILYPTFTTVVISTASENYTVDFEKRGNDFLYIKDTQNIVNTGSRIKFYDSNNSLIHGSTYTNGEYPLKDSGEDNGVKWYKLEIPQNAVKFDLIGTQTINNNVIYPKKSAPQSDTNYTTGNMIYETENNSLKRLYPVFAETAAATSTAYTQRGDKLYIVHSTADSWSNLTVTFNDSNGVISGASGITAKETGTMNYGSSGNTNSTDVSDAVGKWYEVPIPENAVSFSVNGNLNDNKSSLSYPIYEKLSAEDESRNDYTLGDMVYRIKDGSSSSIELSCVYPTFTQTGTAESISNELTPPTPQRHVEYLQNPSENTSYGNKTEITQIPVVHQTATGMITPYEWQEGTSSENYYYIRFADTQNWISSGQQRLTAHFCGNGTSNVQLTPTEEHYNGAIVYQARIPDGNYPKVIFTNKIASDNSTWNHSNGTESIEIPFTDGSYGHGYAYYALSENLNGKPKIQIYEPTPSSTYYIEYSVGGGSSDFVWFAPKTGYTNSGYVEFATADDLHTSGLKDTVSLDGTLNNSSQVDIRKFNKITTETVNNVTYTYTKVRFWFGDSRQDNYYRREETDYIDFDDIPSGYGVFANAITSTYGDPENSSNTCHKWSVDTFALSNVSIIAHGTPCVLGAVYSITYQPEDRYSDNYIYINNDGSWTEANIRVTFYDGNSQEVGTLTKDGSTDTTSSKAFPPESVTVQSGYQYRVLVPKKAVTFKMADGTHTQDNLTVKPGAVYKTSDGSASDTGTSSAKIQYITDMNGRTDKDYIYFTDKNNLIRGTNESDTVYAYYFGGQYGEFTSLTSGVSPVRTYKDNNGNIVYVFQPPLNSSGNTADYPKVIFTNGKADNSARKMTTAINYELGKGYTPNIANSEHYGPVTLGGSDYVNAYTVTERTVSDTDSTYTTTDNQFTFIMNGTEYKSQFYSWDNLHIIFYGSDKSTVIGDSKGYILYESDSDHTNQQFVIDVPDNAEYFQVTNGTDGVTRQSEIAKIESNYQTYQFLRPKSSDDNYPSSINGDYPIRWNQSQPTNDAQVDEDTDVKLATIITGDDGLPKKIIWLKPKDGDADGVSVDTDYLDHTIQDLNKDSVTQVRVVKWGTYYWVEKTSPVGYVADNENTTVFTIGPEEADKNVNIINANNERVKGKITLTKIAKQSAGDTKIGDVIKGATFKLYRINDNDTDNPVEVKLVLKDDGSKYIPNETGSAVPTTGDDGKLVIGELEWGSYYLEEVSAPENSGYKPTVTGTDGTEQENRVYFSVGRNNCEDMQELVCKDETVKAKLQIIKNINERVEAWGKPTFIFKIKHTHKYVNGTLTEIAENDRLERIVSLTLESGLEGNTDYIELEPGTYEIKEVNVSRYDFKTWSYTVKKDSDNSSAGTGTYTDSKTVTLTIPGEHTGEVTYKNEIAYYDKFSHVDAEVNEFGGFKGIRAEYNTLVPIDGNTAVINKSYITLYKILSDGKEEKVTDSKELEKLTFTYVEQSKDDSRFGKDQTHDFSDDTENKQIKITNPSRYADGVYRLKASYEGFTDEFDIRFAPQNQETKEYQKTVIFKADTENYSYFTDNGVRTSLYEFTFTMTKDKNNNYQVYSVKHNGNVIASGDNVASSMGTALETMQNSFQVNEAYSSSKSFAGWLNGTNTYNPINYSQLASLVKSDSSDDVITFTAQLS